VSAAVIGAMKKRSRRRRTRGARGLIMSKGKAVTPASVLSLYGIAGGDDEFYFMVHVPSKWGGLFSGSPEQLCRKLEK